jgi:menaquinone-dependent protoporphyrinogen oxidase
MRVLITAASRHGATAEIAEFLGGALRARRLDAIVTRPDDVSAIDGFDAVVIGSGVYAGHWLKPAKDLVSRCTAELQTRPVWIFSSGPLGDPPKPAEDPVDVPRMLSATGARGHRLFAGRLNRRQLGVTERAIVRMVNAPDGDFRDWMALDAWAGEITTTLTGSAARVDRYQLEAQP